MRKMEDMSKEGGEEERRDEKKENEQKREKRKHQNGSGAGKTREGRQRGPPVSEERKKQRHLVSASVLTPNTLGPYYVRS